MKKSIISIFSVFVLLSVNAQHTNGVLSKGGNAQLTRNCGTTEKMNDLRAQDPVAFDLRQAQTEQEMQNWIANNYDAWKSQRAVITIPVVVQIWESTNAVSDNNVYEQIQTLNEDFRRTNSDASNTPGVFAAVAADCEIEFCLASIDEQGNATTGIVRHNAGGSPSGTSELWDSNKYLNIYVYGIGGGTLGFTYLASQAPNNAVHIGSDYFGTTGAQSPFNRGRTATHEVGHWLNLEHIWGDSNCGNDQVSDTPPAQSDNFSCPSHPHNLGTCTGNTDGEMFMNYMDYVNDNCMNTFTEGQKARMISAINNYRSGLLTSAATNCSGVSVNPDAEFTANSTTINIGQTVNFTDASTGIFGAWNYNWTFTGAATTSSTTMNPTGIQYNNAGVYTVALTIDSGGVSDTETKTNFITVIDPSGSACDFEETVNYPINGTIANYGTQGGGYVAGNNEYGDLAKANYIANPGSYISVKGATIGFMNVVGSSAIPVTVWADNGGSPGAALGSVNVSAATASADIASQSYTNVQFASNIDITGSNFFIGVELPTSAGDTVVVYSNTDGDTNPGIAWELWSDGDWYDMNTAWQGLNIGLTIHPIICRSTVGMENQNNINGIQLYPNPTNGKFTLFINNHVSNTEVTIADITGKIISSSNYYSSSIELDLTNQSNGTYFIKVQTGDQISTHKIQVIK